MPQRRRPRSWTQGAPTKKDSRRRSPSDSGRYPLLDLGEPPAEAAPTAAPSPSRAATLRSQASKRRASGRSP